MNASPMKIMIPALVGLLVTVGAGSWWVNEVISLSFRTEGTTFSKYTPALPAVKNPHPSQIAFCDKANPTRWAGCTVGVKN
jgi:hypothetical protein